MTITATVIADSVSEVAPRLTTLQLRYPKFIHSEFMTHRVFSRNASSSRAIPVDRLIADVVRDPAIPIHWGKNQRGMQAAEECSEDIFLVAPDDGDAWENEEDDINIRQCVFDRREAWLEAMHRAVAVARAFSRAGYHKQLVNRLIEPFCHINVVVTSTEWENFFALRCHEDAQPEMRALAEAMRDAMGRSTARLLEPGDWHLPYAGDVVADGVAVKLSVARCARVSYLTQDGERPTVERDLELYERLVGSVPLHASPAEHQATPDEPEGYGWENERLHGNLCGWIQLRKTLEGMK